MRNHVLRPIGKKVIAEEIKEEKTASGIILSEEEMKKANKDTKKLRVVTSRIDGVSEGDTVVISRFQGTPFSYGSRNYLVLEEKDIECVYPGGAG